MPVISDEIRTVLWIGVGLAWLACALFAVLLRGGLKDIISARLGRRAPDGCRGRLARPCRPAPDHAAPTRAGEPPAAPGAAPAGLRGWPWALFWLAALVGVAGTAAVALLPRPAPDPRVAQLKQQLAQEILGGVRALEGRLRAVDAMPLPALRAAADESTGQTGPAGGEARVWPGGTKADVLLAVADVRRAWNRYPLSGMEGTPLVAELKETGLDVTALAMFYDDLVHVEPACDAHLAAVLLAASSPPDDSRARELLRQWIQRTGELMRNRLVGTQAAGVEALAVLGEAPPPEELRRLHIGRDLAAAKTGLQTAAATLRREYTAEAQRLGFQHRAMVEMGKQLRKTDLSSFRAQIDAALAVGENDPQEEVIAKALALRAFSRRDAAQRAWAQFGEMFAARDPEADRYARIARQFNRELERLKVDFGVYVVRVADAEPAQAGGLTPGDIIIACDGRPVESFRLFLAADGAPAGNKPREVVVLRLGPSGAFSRQTLRIRALPPSDALLPI